MIHIGKKIQEVLEEKNLTVVWFAGELGCSRTNVYKIFDKNSVDCNTMLRISKILNYNFFKLYEAEL